MEETGEGAKDGAVVRGAGGSRRRDLALRRIGAA
ncbi:hypothetical protein NAEX_07100 [Nannocystis exedens]|nr:hypothetical protein NAEX_07100 [Nannocystis exedens]